MSINQRKHIRFSLDIPAFIYSKFGERQETLLQQISIGGCFTGWEENIYIGDEFRMEIQLPNGNYLPLHCKALYRFEHTGIGIKFLDISEFEQELISKIIAHKLDEEGVPLQVDPFELPPTFVADDPSPRISDIRQVRDAMLAKIMAADDGV
ncbi:MAG: PilZ domain-containing protein [Chloracidobacterium sp.]|nr:PilZ domain-containing protein [Chloracidobacterium sp.]